MSRSHVPHRVQTHHASDSPYALSSGLLNTKPPLLLCLDIVFTLNSFFTASRIHVLLERYRVRANPALAASHFGMTFEEVSLLVAPSREETPMATVSNFI